MTDTESEINESPPEEASAAPESPSAATGPADTSRTAPPIYEGAMSFGRRRLPALDFVTDRFVRAAKDSLYKLVRRSVDVESLPVRVRPFSELTAAGAGRPHITLGKVASLNGMAAWVADAPLVFLVVDTIFGGDSRVPPRLLERDLSSTELRILRRMMDGLIQDFENAWQPVHEMRFEHVREEGDLKRVDIAGADDLVFQVSFKIALNGHEGQLDFIVPFWLMESLKATLFEPAHSLQKEIDAHWTERLQNQVQAAEVELVVVLAQEEMKIADVLALNVGDIVPIEVLEPITAYVDGLPMVLGQYGVRNGRYAIKVQHVKHPSDMLDPNKGRG